MTRKKKNNSLDALKCLIKPECDPEKTLAKKIERASKKEETKYELTPAGVLYSTLAEVYGIDYNMEKFSKFQKLLLKSLSELSTNGQHDDLFGDDFNSFYSSYVMTLNICGKMHELLEEHGIEFDFNDQGDEEGTEESDD